MAIIGAGNMAEAIVRGILRSDLYAPAQMIAADVSAQRRDAFRQMEIAAVEDLAVAASDAAIILLSVKPQQMNGVLSALASAINERSMVVSIAAGTPSSAIEQRLGGNKAWRIVRVMPNTPMLVGEGMAAIARGRHATDADLAAARKLFEAAAAVVEVDEDKMDAVTAISGSGPAYFFFLVEQMIQAGMEMGLTREQAHLLATRTSLGAARMLTASADAPAELRRKVTSPGGTTQAAIATMEQRRVPQAIVEALHRACERSRELSAG